MTQPIPYVCKKNLDFILERLEQESSIALKGFEDKNTKMNSDKCHLFVSGNKYKHMWANIDDNKI